MTTIISPRKGMPDVQLTREEFERRFRDRFFDPTFAADEEAIKTIVSTAWDGYDVYRRNPRKARAGDGSQQNCIRLLDSHKAPTILHRCSRAFACCYPTTRLG